MSFFDFWTESIAIDLGTANTLIIHNDKVVVDSPSIVAIDQKSSKIIAVGKEANLMHGKTHENIKIGKAGRNRWKGKRPSVRGVVMNPVDHPHGGGEGKTSGGRHPVTPWGVPTKGKKTRSNKSSDKFIVRTRHQRKKRR